MKITIVFLCSLLSVYARPEPSNYDETSLNHHLDPKNIEEYLEDGLDENARKKKSTVTTFCVEIRPVDEKPYQVCQPVSDKGGYTNSAPYFQQNGGFEHTKSEIPYSASESKPAAAYSTTPVKTYQSSGSSSASKPAYGAYRSKSEHEDEPQKVNPTKITKPEGMEKLEGKPQPSKMQEVDSKRTAHHSDSYHYGSGFGGASSLIPVTPTHQGHQGLVITCQPNLAGYAHSVPNGYHHEEAVPGYNYRSANPSSGRRYQSYNQQPYGNYKDYSPRPVYKHQPQVYKNPIYSHSNGPYKYPVNVPVPHLFKPSAVPESSQETPNDFQAFQPQPVGPLLPHSPAPQAAFSSGYQHQSYQLPGAYYPPPPEAYVPPPTYRLADEDKKTEHLEGKIDKEALTMETMSNISEKSLDNRKKEAEASPKGGDWRLAETGAVSQSGWGNMETPKAANNWREAEEHGENKDDFVDKNNGESKASVENLIEDHNM